MCGWKQWALKSNTGSDHKKAYRTDTDICICALFQNTTFLELQVLCNSSNKRANHAKTQDFGSVIAATFRTTETELLRKCAIQFS